MKTNFSKSIFVILIVLSSSLYSQFQKSLNWIELKFIGDSISKKYYPLLSIHIPFKIENYNFPFEAQLDFGAKTQLYENSILPFLDEMKVVANKLDNSKITKLNGEDFPTFKNVNFSIGKIIFNNRDFVFFKGFGDKYLKEDINKKEVKFVGTIGSDAFRGKIVIIDYPKHRITFLDKLPKNIMKHFSFVDFKIDSNNRVLLPIQINNEDYTTMFDTGNGMFNMTLSSKYWNQFADKENQEIIKDLPSWGNKISAVTSKSIYNIKLGKKLISNAKITKTEPKIDDLENYFDSIGIIGILGNGFFLNETICIDFTNKKFGILK